MQSPPGLVVGAALLAVATVVQRFLSDCACTYTGVTALLHPNSSCRLLVVWWQASVQQKRVRCAAAVVTVHWLPVVTAALWLLLSADAQVGHWVTVSGSNLLV